MDFLATPQPLIYMAFHIHIMTLTGDFLSSLNARCWGSNSCPHRGFPTSSHTPVFLQNCTTLTLPQPVCRRSKCCALHTRNLICMCRTLEVISWMMNFTDENPQEQEAWPVRCWWLWGRKGSVTIQVVNFGLEEWACRDRVLWLPAAYWKVIIELSKWQMALEVLNYPFAHCELDHPKLVSHRLSRMETGNGPLLSAVYL